MFRAGQVTHRKVDGIRTESCLFNVYVLRSFLGLVARSVGAFRDGLGLPFHAGFPD